MNRKIIERRWGDASDRSRSGFRVAVLWYALAACSGGSDGRQAADSTAVLPYGDSSPPSCYVAAQSVLARAPDTTGVAHRGWIRLEHFTSADSGAAHLVDADGFALDAAWRRWGADSVLVSGFNDFVRIEMRLRHGDSAARGTLQASSDAALERDSSGRLREFRRASAITLDQAGCDSMPAPAGGAAIDVLSHGTPRPGIRFDPADVRRGTRIGTLSIDSIEFRRAMDSTLVGTARFRGEIALGGWTMRHPDPDAYRAVTCFEADSASAAQLPRWAGDERRPWFCFSNRTEAARALGPPSEGVRATIVIDRFTIHRGMSDEVNSARFLRRLRQ